MNCEHDTRTRPHTPAAPDEVARIQKILLENREGIVERLSSPFSKEVIEEMREVTRKHDATIRNQTLKDEREKRIKDYEHLKTHIIETCNYHGGNWIVDQIINRINHRIESLRHQSTEAHK